MSSKISFPIQLEQELAWGEQDALGHVNNTLYFRYFENARVAHFRAIGLGFPNPGSGGCGPILASTSCNFLKPLTYPDRIRIECGVSRLGNSSFNHSYRIFSQSQQSWVAEGEAVTVYYDYATGKSTPLPAELRQRIEELQNQAPCG